MLKKIHLLATLPQCMHAYSELFIRELYKKFGRYKNFKQD